jgi:ABC-type glycerol-3-phosphate transport system permease component
MASFGFGTVAIVRTYFQSSIPGELFEAAQIDGSSDVGYFVKIAIPLSKPIIAVQMLNYIVSVWNSYMGPMIYLRKRELKPLQLILQEILASTQVDAMSLMDPSLAEKMSSVADIMKYAIIIVGSVPMMMIYPFIKKYFEKGMMIGSLKG